MATERLLLRKMAVADACDMYEYASLEETAKYLLWSPHQSIKFTKNYLKYIQKQYKNGNYFDWAIVIKETGKMIGTCGFSAVYPEHSRAEIGYVINPMYKGNGYATEAAERVMSFAFEELDINRLEAKFMIENLNSENVMKKLGMKREGVLRDFMFVKGNYEDICMYSITADDYFKNKYNI